MGKGQAAPAKRAKRSPEDESWMRENDIQGALETCERLLASGIFSINGVMTPFFEPSVVHLLINLNDLLGKAKSDGRRIGFTDDIDVTEKIPDVTELIRTMRNAACHIGSPENDVGLGKFRFCTVAGNRPRQFQIGEFAFGCDYEDDFAIFYGIHRVYFRRHLVRAIEALRQIYPRAG